MYKRRVQSLCQNQIKSCPHRENMKVLIVLVCSLAGFAHGSLEPAGYRPPGSYPQSSYLPPASSSHHSLPKNSYIPSSVGSSSHSLPSTFNNQVSNSFSLPSKNSPVPFSQYLPANQQQSHQGVATIHGSNFGENSRPSNQYIPANEHQNTFTQTIPVNDYLPPRQNENKHSGPSNAYLAPNVQTHHSSNGFSRPSGIASHGHYSGAASANRHSKIDQGTSGHYSFGHGNQHSASTSAGYNYNAPENHVPAQYDFEYKVKDNYGNDYGHKESRNGENTQGVYTVLLPDGRRQIVHYEADSHGYRPTITYEQAGSQSGYNNQGYHY